MVDTSGTLYIIAVIGSIVGLVGLAITISNYVNSQRKDVKADVKEQAEWRGRVDGKLDSILGLTARVERVEDAVQQHEIDISKLKDSSRRAHERIDEMERDNER